LYSESKIHCISSAAHARFKSISSSKTHRALGRIPYLWIARWIEILQLNCCSAPGVRDRCGHFVASSAISNKLASDFRDGGMKASLSSSRAVFEFLALAVRRWPSIWRAGLNSLATIWKRTLINRGWVAAASHSLPTHKAPVPTIVRSCPITDKLLQCRECPLSAKSGLMHRIKEQLYSITSSARPIKGSGIFNPSAFAVFRLMTNSTFVDCWTGRSAGFSPLRIRPT